MSHIPSAAMPHAKPHETPTIAPEIRRDGLPWAALAAGGMLAIGGAITTAWLLRGRGKRSSPSRTRRGAASKTRKAASSRKKPAAHKSRKASGGDS